MTPASDNDETNNRVLLERHVRALRRSRCSSKWPGLGWLRCPLIVWFALGDDIRCQVGCDGARQRDLRFQQQLHHEMERGLR